MLGEWKRNVLDEAKAEVKFWIKYSNSGLWVCLTCHNGTIYYFGVTITLSINKLISIE